MKELAAAIMTYYKTDPLSSALSQLYLGTAPNDATFPYGTFNFISNIQDITFTERFEMLLVQFDIYSNDSSSEEIFNLYNLLKGDENLGTGFDFAEFPLNGYVIVYFSRESAILNKWYVNNEWNWHYSVTYRVLLEKQ